MIMEILHGPRFFSLITSTPMLLLSPEYEPLEYGLLLSHETPQQLQTLLNSDE